MRIVLQYYVIFELLLSINVNEMNVCVLGNGFFPQVAPTPVTQRTHVIQFCSVSDLVIITANYQEFDDSPDVKNAHFFV